MASLKPKKVLASQLLQADNTYSSNSRQRGVALACKSKILGTNFADFSWGQLDEAFAKLDLFDTTLFVGCLFINSEQKNEIVALRQTTDKALYCCIARRQQETKIIFDGWFHYQAFFFSKSQNQHRWLDIFLNQISTKNSIFCTIWNINLQSLLLCLGENSAIDLGFSKSRLPDFHISTINKSYLRKDQRSNKNYEVS